MALAKKLEKVGVVVGNCRGFVGNRMMMPYMREAQFLVGRRRDALAGRPRALRFRHGDGHLRRGRHGRHRCRLARPAENRHLEKPGARSPLVLDKLYEMGRYGQKTGAGWYRYDENRKPIPDPEVDALIEKTAREAGIERRAIGSDEIIERCIYSLINEGARILEEGYALRASDIDVIYLTGYGFPAYRGGPMWYADTVGLAEVYRRIQEFHRVHGDLWAPAPLLTRLATEGKTFAEWDASAAERQGRATTS